MNTNQLIFKGVVLSWLWLGVSLAAWAQTPQVSTVPHDATIIDIVGDVLVNQGEKYVPASEGMKVKNGDRVMVLNNSKATVRYDSCLFSVESFDIYQIDDKTCAALLTEQTQIAATQPASTPLLKNPGFIGSVIGIIIAEKIKPVSP